MKITDFPRSIEVLETRIAPSSLDIVGGVLTYTATAGSFNSIAIFVESVNGGTDNQLLFRDAENITLGSAAQAAGFTYAFGGQADVRGSLFAFNSFNLDLGDQNDSLFIDRLTKPLTAQTGAGTDSVTINSFSNSTPLAVNGALSLTAETITVQKVINSATNVSFTTDNLDIQQAVNASGSITLLPLTPGRAFDLGTQDAGRVSLTPTETANLVAPSILIGNATSGSIFSDAAVSFGSAAVSLTVGSAATISQTGAGAITAGALAIDSANGSNIVLNGANNVSTFAARLTSPGAGVAFTDATGFSVATVGSITGISSAGGVVTLNAGAVTQASGASILTGSLSLLGAGPFTLNEPTNHITGFVAMTTNAISYTDVSGFTVGAGSVVTSNADVTLTTNLLGINGTINAGTGNVTIKPLGSAITIDVGGSDVFGTTLGLSATDFSRITAGTLFIGGAGTTAAVNVSDAVAPANIGEIYIQAGTVSGTGSITVPELTLQTTGAVTLTGANDVNTLTLLAGSPIGASSFADADGFTLGNPFNVAGTQITTFDVGTATVTLPSAATFIASINGTTPGSGYDQVVVNGTVNIAGTTLSAFSGPLVPAGREFVIINNDGADAITGTFDGLDEGDMIPGFSPAAKITYVGGDGNDVAIITADPVIPGVGATGRTLFFTDVDGDDVTITASKGTFTGNEVSGVITGLNGEGRFEKLTLGAGFSGANISITAKPGANGGNGFVNLGFLDATGVDLGAVTIAGDVARISAGTVGGDANVPALKSLTVQSLGLLGESTLAGADQGVFLGLQIKGSVSKLTVKDDLRAEIDIADGGSLGTATIGGSIVGSGNLAAAGGIGLLKVAGDIRAVGGTLFIVSNAGAIGGVTVDGSIVGADATHPVHIGAFGQPTAPTRGLDVAIKNVTVKGSVVHGSFGAGTTGALNADASIGSISVGGDWIATSVVAGVGSGADSSIGTADDTKLTGTGRDNADIQSSIGSFTVKGQVFGTAATGDMFGIVAEQIGKAKVGGRTFAFTKTGNEAFFAAPTLGGTGAENPMFDFTIRELGASTPAGTVTGGSALTFSNGDKTVTFFDVDGDLVTVKRTVGEFVPGNFGIVPKASGGGLFDLLSLSDEPGNLTITAKPGPDGGNGFVNLGSLNASGINLGAVSIAGDLGGMNAGLGGLFGVKSLVIHSSGQAGTGGVIAIAGNLGKLTIGTDVRDSRIILPSGELAAGTVGGSLIGGSVVGSGAIFAQNGIGSLKIGGGIRSGAGAGSGAIDAGQGAIGALTIAGDLAGTATNPALISAYGQLSIPLRGTDIAIKSLTINGSVANARIEVGTNTLSANADASIGTLTVGHGWLASTALAGAVAGTDTFEGTADDAKIASIGVRDAGGLFSSIANITIKGQALGSAAAGDSFGIVAEQIGAAKIGTVKRKFDAGERDAADAFAIAPTLPGAGTLAFDFYVRELTV